jgi:hypothetical protein
MNKITVVCHKDHSHGYEDFQGECLLCVVEKLRDENHQLTHQLYDYRAAFIRARDREWVGLTDEAIWLEYQQLWPFHPAEEPTLPKDIAKFARAIEAKLKERNNG